MRVASPPPAVVARSPETASRPAVTSLAQSPQRGNSPLLDAHRGVSSFQPVGGARQGVPSGKVAEELRKRINDMMRGMGGYEERAEQIANTFTQEERERLMATPPEQYQQVKAEIEVHHRQLFEQMHRESLSIGQLFGPGEKQSEMRETTQALKDAVNKTFDDYSRNLQHMPLNERRVAISQMHLARHDVLQRIDAAAPVMANSQSSFEDVARASGQIRAAIASARMTLDRTLSSLPYQMQPQARAELEKLYDNQAQAVHNQFVSALQPSSHTEFNQLPGGAPPMKGPLTDAQASEVLKKLESGIQQQYQKRLNASGALPPDARARAEFDAQIQRDRMLVNAYINVHNRLPRPAALPPPLP